MKNEVFKENCVGLDSEGYGFFLLQISTGKKIYFIDFWKLGFNVNHIN